MSIPSLPLDYAHTCMNHFVTLDLRETGEISAGTLSDLAMSLCSSPLCDDVLVLEPSTKADARLRIFGGDGREAEFCANGLLYASSKIGDDLGLESVTIQTPAGVRRASRDGRAWQAEVGLAERLEFDPSDFDDLSVLGLMRAGEPHLVLDRPDALPGFNIDRSQFEQYCGPLRDRLGVPGGINITVVFQQQDDSVLIRTFERGVKRHTFSCGTGAVAAIAAVFGTPDGARRFHVCSPGGMHDVFFDGARWHLAARPVRIGSGVLRDGQICLPLAQLEHYAVEPEPLSALIAHANQQLIGPERFGDNRDRAMRLLERISTDLTALLGVATRLDLVSEVDDILLARMEQIEEEIFRVEDNVYTVRDLLECLATEDALLLVLTIGGTVEGYLFGYADEPEDPVVEGSDYFVDSGAISLAYEAKGIGSRLSLPVLFLIYLLGYEVAGVTTEERDKSGRKLADFYRKMGFVDASVNREGDVGIGLTFDLTRNALKRIADRLPQTHYLAEALDD